MGERPMCPGQPFEGFRWGLSEHRGPYPLNSGNFERKTLSLFRPLGHKIQALSVEKTIARTPDEKAPVFEGR